MVDSQQYWNARYDKGEGSGWGSEGKALQHKAAEINNIILDNSVSSVVDLGVGDGKLLNELTGFDLYFGYDISITAINKLKSNSKYANAEGCFPQYHFYDDIKQLPYADLAMSVDVIYHILEDDRYKEYMDTLFSKSKLVYIYSTNKDETARGHVRHREFLKDVPEDWELIENIPSAVSTCSHFLFKHKDY